MGRITVSLPDEVEAELDAYASQHSKPVSQVVAEALTRFLHGDLPAPSPPNGDGLVITQEYLARLAIQVERIRVSLDEFSLWSDSRPPGGWESPVPPPLPSPPWRKSAAGEVSEPV